MKKSHLFKNILKVLNFIDIKLFFIYSFCVISYDIIKVAIPYIRKDFIDKVLITLNSNLFLKFVIIIILVEIIHAILLFFSDTLYDITMINLTNNSRKSIIEKLFKMNFKIFKNYTPEKINSILINDVDNLKFCTSKLISILISDSISIILILITIFSFNKFLFLAFLSLIPFQFLILKFLENLIKKFSKEEREELNNVYKYINEIPFVKEIITISKKIKSYINHINLINISYKKKYMKKNITLNSLNSLNDFVNIIGYSIVIILGGILIFRQKISIGIFVALLSYHTMLYDPVSRLVNNIGEIKSSFISVNNIFKILNYNEDLGKKVISLSNNNPNLIINKLSFSYFGNNIIKNFSYSFNSGKIYKIQAQSGKGKTTLFKLITLIENDYDGEILINNIDIKLIKDIYNYICYLPQDNIIFNSSIKSNITLFDDKYKEEEIIKYLQKLNLLEDFKKLPAFLNEIINIKDKKLSGGQLRRLCICRLLLINPDAKIYLFDEPFSGLDEKNIRQLIITIKEILKDKIVIINSHDLAFDNYFDEIIKL